MGVLCVCVPHDSMAVKARCGAFQSIEPPGWVCMPVPGAYTLNLVSTRVREHVVDVETKTKDNVFLNVHVAVQYQVIRDQVRLAFYSLTNVGVQLRAYVHDAVRSSIPNRTLDEVFEGKSYVSREVEAQLRTPLAGFGYKIVAALVVDVSPAMVVKTSMNEINANRRKRIAAGETAEAQKIVAIKRAEAEAESKYLQGEGIARQRRAIVEGLRDSVTEFSDRIAGMVAKDVLELVLITQYFDTLKDIGERSTTTTVFVPHNPGALGNISTEIRGTFSSKKK